MVEVLAAYDTIGTYLLLFSILQRTFVLDCNAPTLRKV